MCIKSKQRTFGSSSSSSSRQANSPHTFVVRRVRELLWFEREREREKERGDRSSRKQGRKAA